MLSGKIRESFYVPDPFPFTRFISIPTNLWAAHSRLEGSNLSCYVQYLKVFM